MHIPRACAVLSALLLLAACASPRADLAPAELPGAPLDDPWFSAGRGAVAARARALGPAGRARSVILFVGDGMGVSTVTAARILQGQRRGEPGEGNWLAFERLPHVGLSRTYNTDQQVPDSAGTMTAMMSGVKTRAGVIGVDSRVARGDPAGAVAARVPTLLEQAAARGLATGVVTTARVTHATPAACYAHAPERDWEDDARLSEAARAAGFADIARQLVEAPHPPRVVLGGGRSRFLPRETVDPEYPERHGRRHDGRDLTAEWRARTPGAVYVWNAAQLAALDPARARPVLGLFEPSHMQWEADRAGDAAGEPSLAEMTAFAIDALAGAPGGFFLMVEAGRIDHGHHAASAHRALGDTIALSDAVAVALERTRSSETLIVVTADHSHVLTIAGYPARGNPILGLARGPRDGAEPGEPLRDALGLPYTTLGYANGPGYPGASDAQGAGPKRFPHRPRTVEPATGRPDLSRVDVGAPGYLQESGIPLGSETHAGEDVPIYAGGPGAALLGGVHEQNELYHALTWALGWWR